MLGDGRRRVGHDVVDAKRNFSGVCGRWYPVLLDFHRLFIAISRAVVNHDGRDGGVLPKRRGPPAIWASGWFNIPASAVGAGDIAHWPYSVSLLVKWDAF